MLDQLKILKLNYSNTNQIDLWHFKFHYNLHFYSKTFKQNLFVHKQNI